jgi:hypothetical protein
MSSKNHKNPIIPNSTVCKENKEKNKHREHRERKKRTQREE